MQWVKKAQELREAGMSYKDIATEVNQTKSAVYYQLTGKINKQAKSSSNAQVQITASLDVEPQEPAITSSDVKKLIIPVIKRPKTVDQIVAKMPKGTTASVVIAALDELEQDGFTIDKFDDKIVVRTMVTETINEVIHRDWSGARMFKFGVVSDPHLNSKYQQLTHLNSFYDLCVQEGITEVYNAGDIVEGTYLHRAGHLYEIFNHSADDQVDYVIENYPRREGINTYFITGNHDHTHLKNGGYDIGKTIGKERDDMHYLGINEAKIQLTPNCRMDLVHPGDGSSYALSYALQKSIEAMPVDDIPQIYVVGHHHKAIYLHTRGIHALEAGTFQAQTSWMKGKRLAAHVGGWIITVHVDQEGRIIRFQPELIPFSKMVQNDY